jgi:HEAT repeat protein
MSLVTLLPAALPTKQPWFWIAADTIVAVLVLLNGLLIVLIYGRQIRGRFRGWRGRRFRPRFERMLDELQSEHPDGSRMRRELRGLDKLERPIAADMLIEEVTTGSAEQREGMLGVLREVGGIDLMIRAMRRPTPWRRALAIRTLGELRADEAVPDLIARLDDRSRPVREAAVRALGEIGDERAVPRLAEMFVKPGAVGPGLVFEALVSIGDPSAKVFREGLGSPHELVRVAAVLGVASLLGTEASRSELERMLADPAGPVRAAAADMLGRVGGARLSRELVRATRDEERTVRRAAVAALARYDDRESVRLATEALGDPDRDTALCAGDALVRLSRQPTAGGEAAAAMAANDSWPLQTALVLSSLETR